MKYIPRNEAILLAILLAAAMPSRLEAQQNIVRTYVPRTALAQGSRLDAGNSIATVDYYDCAGRLVQNLSNGATPSGGDMASMRVYDRLGRAASEWKPCPFEYNGGQFVPLQSFLSSAHCDSMRTDTEYEQSALGRVTRTIGENVPGRSRKIEYLFSNDMPEWPIYDFCMAGDCAITNNGVSTRSMKIVKTTDEDGIIWMEAFDDEERKVFERHNGMDTYYIYNDYGELCCVLPPDAVFGISDETGIHSIDENDSHDPLNNYAYFYTYDNRGNRNGTKLPGCGWRFTIYDKGDRPVLTQSAEQRKRNEWSFTLFDDLGREALRGTAIIYSTRESLASHFESELATVKFSTQLPYGYATNALPSSSAFVTSASYYDNYDFLNLPDFSTLSEQYKFLYQRNAQSLCTGNYTAALDSSGHEAKAIVYDKASRVSGKISINTATKINMRKVYTYDFNDNILKEEKTWWSDKWRCVATTTSAYDHAMRPTESSVSLTARIDGKEAMAGFDLAQYSYDSWGRIETVNIFNGLDTRQTTYRGDGKLRSSASRLYSETVAYGDEDNEPEGEIAGVGRISSWSSKQRGGSIRFKIGYDRHGRMQEASSGDGGFEEQFSFDNMGNVCRRMFSTPDGLVNDLSIYNIGNRPAFTRDSHVPRYPPYRYYDLWYRHSGGGYGWYEYDSDGNEVRNLSQNVEQARYNILNLPQGISFSDGGEMTFTYMADGRRVGTRSWTPASDVVLQQRPTTELGETPSIDNNQPPTALQQRPTLELDETVEGELTIRDGKPFRLDFGGSFALFDWSKSGRKAVEPYYYIADRIGNIRLVCDGNTGEEVQSMKYMPSGLVYEDTNASLQSRRFCGKEEISLHGLDMYDSKARFQWATFPRFTSIDPMCEKYYSVSPYAYCNGDFVNAVDPDGKYITYYNSVNEKSYVYYNGDFYTFDREKGLIIPKHRVYVPKVKNNLMYNVLLALRFMDSSKNKYIEKVFNTVSDLNSKFDHTIQKNNSSKGSVTSAKNSRRSIIKLNLEKDKKGSDFIDIGLDYYELVGHELKHSYDNQFYKQTEGKTEKGTEILEFYTVNFENLIRKERKRKPRLKYDGEELKQYINIIKIWD